MSVDPKEILIIGGGSIYAAFLQRVRRLYVTWVHAEIEGDTHFPHFDLDAWREVRRDSHRADEKNPYDHEFVVYEPATAAAP